VSGLIDSQCTTVEVRELNRSAHLHNQHSNALLTSGNP
jgi:hypothetical protein